MKTVRCNEIDRNALKWSEISILYKKSIQKPNPSPCKSIPLIKLPNHKLRRLWRRWQPEEPNSSRHHAK
jgi:hypothetical protein